MAHRVKQGWSSRVKAASLAWVFSGALVACGGGGSGSTDAGSTDQPVQVDSSRTVTATLGSLGGRITATAADGTRYTLEVPADALAASTAISLTPITSLGSAPLARGLRGAVRMAPSGLVFRTPATLRIEAPQAGAAAPAGQQTVAFSRSEDGRTIRLGAPAKSTGVLTLPVFHFSDAGASDATDQEILELPKPPTPSEILTESINEGPYRAGAEFNNDFATAETLRELFDSAVMGALSAAAGGLNVSEALDGYTVWLRFLDLTTPVVRDLLSGEIAQAQPRVAALIRGEFDKVMATCTGSPQGANALTVARLLLQQLRAQKMGVATVAEGLDPATTLARINDCVRPVLDPINLPLPMTVGQGFSLDARATLVFAIAPQAPLDAGFGFAFTVTSNEASLARNGRGFSDSSGRFTVVATPASTLAQFDVKACVVYPDGNNANPTVTSLCVSTAVPDRCTRTVSGTFINSAAALEAAQDLAEVGNGGILIDAGTTANLGSVILPCLRKAGNVSVTGSGGITALKFPRLTEIGGSFVMTATGVAQVELPVLASARSISIRGLHGSMTGFALGPARLTDTLQFTSVDRANPPDLRTLFSGLDGMSVDIFGFDSSTSGVLCRSAVESLLGRIEVRNPNGKPTLAFLLNC